jgi:glycosyltransferase involved in cell wall biosynthesis
MIKELKTDPDKIEVVHGAVDSLFKPAKDAGAIEKIKKIYNISDKYILSVGRLDPRKNILRLIEAFKIFKKNKDFTHKLVIVGKKDYLSSAIEKAIKEMPDQIIMAGYVPDESLAVLYSRAEVFVYPSLFEGFGLPVLEAMACGCPVISSNTSSIPEVSGGAALLIDPYKVEEIAAAINKVVLDDRLREEMILKGLKRAEFFKWGFSAGKLLKVFERII